MERDAERLGQRAAALDAANRDARCCRLPHNVPLLTGYWPMLGTAIALLTRAGDLALIVPEDEHVLAQRGWVADEQITSFRPGANTVSLARDGRRNVPEPACGWCARTSRHAIVVPVCALIETV